MTPDHINAILCAVITLRIITYRRGPMSRYRMRHSVAAYFVATSAGGYTLSVAILPALAPYLLTMLFAVMAISLITVRGNVSELFKYGA